jgi:hypothetical protein
MDSSVNSFLIAPHVQDLIAEATSARDARAASSARPRQAKLRHVRRLLGRHAQTEPASVTVTTIPPVV